MASLEQLSTVDVPEDAVAIVPTGSTEQHGPALPLGTDTAIASALAAAAAERREVVVTPAVPVGVSVHHRHFEGTLWVAESTFRDYVGDVLRSLASHGLDRAVIVNGHGGNVSALGAVARELKGERTAFAAVWNWWEAIEEAIEAHFDDLGGHACHVETSLMLAVDEARVRRSRLEAAEAGAPPGWGHRVHGADVGHDTIDFTPTGAVGRPTAGNRDDGEALFAAATDELVAFVDWLADRPAAELFATAAPTIHRG
ncbi:MAG: creatininase family protein [Halobacteriales archaeon]